MKLAARACWPLLAALLALLALATWALPQAWSSAIDWQPALALRQPWRAFSAALLHLSDQHLLANLAGCAVLALLGWTIRMPARACQAWLLAWPLTQLGLLARPALQHYGGLSGVLHAGVMLVVLTLLARRGRERLIGALILIGLLTKLYLEDPLGPLLQAREDWDILIAPIAHLSGVLAALVSAAIVRGLGLGKG